jgi:hypothetical protein
MLRGFSPGMPGAAKPGLLGAAASLGQDRGAHGSGRSSGVELPNRFRSDLAGAYSARAPAVFFGDDAWGST